MVMHSQQGDVQIKLLNVAYVPGVQFNLFSLHAVMQKCHFTLDAEGVPWAGRRGDVWGDVATKRTEHHLGKVGVRLEVQRAW